MNDDRMTSYERVMKALMGGQPDRVPVVPMIREWCARQAGFRFIDIINSAQKHVFSQYYCLRHFGYDAVWDLAGVHAESEAMGSVLQMTEDMCPSLLNPAVGNYDKDLAKLHMLDPQKDGRLPVILEGNKRLKELCEKQYPVMGYVQGPFRHAAMLRGPENAYRDILKNPKRIKELLEIATESLIIYGTSVAQAGADIIIIFDPTSSGDAISRAAWEEFGFPYTERAVREIKKRTGIPMILHVCGDIMDRLDSLAETGVEGLSIDSKVDLAETRKILGDSICLFGNVDPVSSLLFGKPEDVAKETECCILSAGQNGNFILSSGGMLPSDVPPQNVQAMVDTAKKIGVYPLA